MVGKRLSIRIINILHLPGNNWKGIGKESEPNVLGIYDLCGNVAEACQDAEDSNYDYPYRILKGGACVSTDRSVFGGSAQDPMRAYRPAYRDRVYQDDRIEWLGFRLVLDK